MTDQDKRNYNKRHYQKNREAILGRVKAKYKPKKQSSTNVISLFQTKEMDPSPPDREKSKILQLPWGTLFLQIFVAIMTGLLIHETAHFYISVDESRASAYLKAFILEGAVFAFALMKARTILTSAAYKLMILFVYVYSAWAISNSVIQHAYHQHSQIVFHEKSTGELEREIHTKTALRDTLLGSNRVTMALKIDKSLIELKSKLEKNRETLLGLPNTTVVLNTLLTLVAFRILVMITNLFCLRELRRRYRMKFRIA